ncbi:RibD family protein [Gryllotalpicola reticulitermitis]|uniref:RibD family protein n=1 Tax=Gryllotalpicola reticulitermitis TaxID=1184153 RepID=A0ABV8QAS9_9MICO
MTTLPYVTVSCAMSIDGYLDRADGDRLVLSNPADLDRVDELRGQHDAIMVGASTIRRDDSSLLVKSADRRSRRIARGLSYSPAKVTVTSSGRLPRDAAFFTTGAVDRLVYCPAARVAELAGALGECAVVVGLGTEVTMRGLLEDLAARGIHRLMVEGGGTVLTQFLADGLVDELQLVIAPLFLGDEGDARIVSRARFPWTAAHRATVSETRQIGDVVLVRYALSDRAERRAGHGASGGPVLAGRKA